MSGSLRKIQFWVAGLLLAAVFLSLAVTGWRRRDQGVEALPLATYTANPASLSGNTYRLRGIVDSLLRRNDRGDRLVLVKPLEGDLPVAVLVPGTAQINIVGGQRFSFIITVEQEGLLYAQSLEKY